MSKRHNSRCTYSSSIFRIHEKNCKRFFLIWDHCVSWSMKTKSKLSVCELLLAKIHASDLSSSSVVRVLMNARCQSCVLCSDSVYARSERLILTRELIRWSSSALILTRREIASFADKIRMNDLVAFFSFKLNSSSTDAYENTWHTRSEMSVASMMTWTFESSTSKELILTLREEFLSHEIAFLKALTLFSTKSIFGLKLMNVELPEIMSFSMNNTIFRSAKLSAADSEWPILLLIEPMISDLLVERVAAKTELILWTSVESSAWVLVSWHSR